MISRRAMLAAALAVPLFADDAATEVWDVLAAMAGALGDGDTARFLRAFDPAMAGYENLRTDVTGLVARAEVESTIDPVANTGDDRSRTLEVDWHMRLVDRSPIEHATERRSNVKCVLEKQAGRWRVVSIAPIEFFKPN